MDKDLKKNSAINIKKGKTTNSKPIEKILKKKILKIYLVRHGETVANKQYRFLGQFDVDLSTDGKKQAQNLAEKLENKDISSIYSSDLSRAIQTAKAIAKPHGLENRIITNSDLREINFGEWEGFTYSEIESFDKERLSKWVEDYESQPIPGGELWKDFKCRVIKAFNEILVNEYKKYEQECFQNESKKVNTQADFQCGRSDKTGRNHDEYHEENKTYNFQNNLDADIQNADKKAEKQIVIVSHGGPIRLIASYILNNDEYFKTFWPAPGSLHWFKLLIKGLGEPSKEIVQNCNIDSIVDFDLIEYEISNTQVMPE